MYLRELLECWAFKESQHSAQDLSAVDIRIVDDDGYFGVRGTQKNYSRETANWQTAFGMSGDTYPDDLVYPKIMNLRSLGAGALVIPVDYLVLGSDGGEVVSTTDFTLVSGDYTLERIQQFLDRSGVDPDSIRLAVQVHFDAGTVGEEDPPIYEVVSIDDYSDPRQPDRCIVLHIDHSDDLYGGSAPSETVADFEADNTNPSDGGTVNFTDLSTNDPISWEWDFGDGDTSTEENPSHVYNGDPNDQFDVTLTVYNGINEDTEEKTKYITIAGI